MNRLAALLLDRRLVAPDLLATGPIPDLRGPVPASWQGLSRTVSVSEGLIALEADLLELGCALSAPLRRRLAELDAWELTIAGRHIVGAMRSKVGGHVDHVPLFRGFPESVPEDTFDFYVRRVFTVLLQEPEQPCVLCGKVATVHPVSPCAHLVCRACWDGSDFSACPICHRRIDPDDPFLLVSAPDAEDDTARDLVPHPRLRLLSLCEDPWAAAEKCVRELLSGQAALRPEDLESVAAFVDTCAPRSARWLPDVIPSREGKATALAALLARAPETLPDLLDRHVDTATDVLRLLNAAMDGDAGLRRARPIAARCPAGSAGRCWTA